jgi:hypothetical protein
MRRIMLVLAGCALLSLSITPALAGSYTTGTVVQASGDSPFNEPPFDADCATTTGGGEVFPNSEVEPWVDVSPVNPKIIAGIWQQDRWSNGGARGNVAGISLDGGTSWELLTFPGVTECTGGDFDRASDPWLSFSPNGDLHVMHLVLDITPPPGRPGGFGANGMMAQKIPAAAFAGGVDESEVSDPILIAFDDRGDLHDKNTMTADPLDADFVYAVWDFLDLPTGATINPDRGVFGGGLGFKGAALFSRTTDGGETWSEPTVLYNPGGVNQTIGNQIVVDDRGVLFNFFNEILNFRNDDGGSQFDFNLSLKFSENRGETWLPRGRPIRAQKMLPVGIRIPAGDDNPGAPVRAAAVLFDVAVDPVNGNLYAVWQDGRFSGFAHDDVAFSMSVDGGRTWSAPIRVNQTPGEAEGIAVDNRQAHTPSVHVAADGTVGVSYYDFRNNAPGNGTDTDHWLVHCHGGCSTASGWTDEVRVVDESFDIQRAPFANGFFLGDYVGLDNVGDSFTPFFTRTTTDDPANIYYATVSPDLP